MLNADRRRKHRLNTSKAMKSMISECPYCHRRGNYRKRFLVGTQTLLWTCHYCQREWSAGSRDQIDQIESLAWDLRLYLEGNWPQGYSIGQCVQTSVLVAKVFNETFDPVWNTVSGTFRGGGWHCWVTNNDLIVDLTADQFNNTQRVVAPPVLIVPMDDDRYVSPQPYVPSKGLITYYYSGWRRWRIHRSRPAGKPSEQDPAEQTDGECKKHPQPH